MKAQFLIGCLLAVSAGVVLAQFDKPAQPCEPVFKATANNRAMPSLYTDQALASIPHVYPAHVLMLQRRSARIGAVEYSLVAYKRDAAVDAVTIEGAAVVEPRAWTFTSTCNSQAAMDSLAVTLERIAALAGPATADAWSPVVQGVRGRLVATPAWDDGRAQIRLEVELENVTNVGTPIEIWWNGWSQLLDLSVHDAAGTQLPRLNMAGNELIAQFWLQLMPHSTTRMLITSRAFEFTSPDRLMLRPTVFQGWALTPLKSQDLYLSGKLIGRVPSKPKTDARPGNRAWIGSLALPGVSLRIP